MPTRIHLGARAGFTSCRIFIPDLPAGDRYWIPPHLDADTIALGDKPPPDSPVTCEYCRNGEPAPACSMDPAALRMFVVYGSPRDFPGEYVVREVRVLARARGGIEHGAIVARGPTLGAVRRQLLDSERGPGLYRLPRNPDDDPVIVEVWI